MDNSDLFPKSNSDSSWINQYILKMGESKFWDYKNRVYDFLSRLELGQFIVIEKYTTPETIDLFVKVAYCFITESNYCYSFAKDYTQIKHYFDAREMEKTLALLKYNREHKDSGGDGGGTGSGSERTEALSSQPQVVQNQQ